VPQYPPQTQILGIGGFQSALNISAATVIKGGPGTLFSIATNNAGSSGNLVVNDCSTIGAASAANQILSLSAAQLATLQGKRNPIRMVFPCLNGITISSVPTGAAFSIAFS
jgi:hypothetical protein